MKFNSDMKPDISAQNSDGSFNQAVGHMASSAHEAVEKFASHSHGMAENLQEKGVQINELQQRWLAPVRSYVQENPVTSLSIALAGGYLVSRLLSSR